MKMIEDKLPSETPSFNEEEIQVNDKGYSYTYRIYDCGKIVDKIGIIRYNIKGRYN